MFTALGLNAQYSTKEQFKDLSSPWIKTKEQLVIAPELLNIKSFSNQQYLYTNNIVVDGDNLSGSNNLDFVANNTKKFFDIENTNNKYYEYYEIFTEQLELLNTSNENSGVVLSGEDFDNQLKNNLYLKLDNDYPELDKSIFNLALLNNTHGSINDYQISNGHIYFYKTYGRRAEIDYIKIIHSELDGTVLNSIDFTEFKSSQTFTDLLEEEYVIGYPVLYIVGDYIFCSYFANNTFSAVDVYHWNKIDNTINYIKYMNLIIPRGTELINSFYVSDDLSKILFYEQQDLATNTLIYDINNLYINSTYQVFPGIGKYLNPSNYLVWITNDSEAYFKLYKTTNYGMPTAQIGEKLLSNIDLSKAKYYYYNNKLYVSEYIFSTPLPELFEIPLPPGSYPSNIIKKIPEDIINNIQIDVIYGRTYTNTSTIILDDGLNDIVVHKVPESWNYIDNKLYIEYKVSNIKSIRYKLKVYVPKNIYVIETNTIFTTYEIKDTYENSN